MQNKKKKDLQKVAKRESYFSTLAKKEGKGASKRAVQEKKSELKQSAADSRWEAEVDEEFSELRKKKAARYKKNLQK